MLNANNFTVFSNKTTKKEILKKKIENFQISQTIDFVIRI